MGSPQPCFSPFIPSRIERINKELLLLVMLTGLTIMLIGLWKAKKDLFIMRDIILKNLDGVQTI